MDEVEGHGGSAPLFRPEAVRAAYDRFGVPVRPVGVASWLLTCFLILVAIAVIGFAAEARYARKETVQGVLQPSRGALRISASKTGTIGEVFVQEGQFVPEDTPLLTIEKSETVKGGAQLSDLLDQAAEAQNRALVDQGLAHKASVQRQQDELVAKRRGVETEMARLSADQALQARRVGIQQAGLDALTEVHSKHFITEVQYQDKQNSLIESQQSLSAIKRQLEADAASLRELDAQARRFVSDAAESEAELRSSRASLSEKQANNAADSQITLTAPKAGRVVALQAKPGAPITSSAALAILLPQGATLEAELWAPSRAAGFVRPGDKVRLLYDSFPYERFGVGHGRVTTVASAPTVPNELPVPIETRESLYRIVVTLERQDVAAYGKRWSLAPGMRLTADLVLDSRSFLDWLLDPLLAIKRRGEV